MLYTFSPTVLYYMPYLCRDRPSAVSLRRRTLKSVKCLLSLDPSFIHSFTCQTPPGIYCNRFVLCVFVSMCLSVCENVSKSTYPINFIFGRGLPSGPRMRWFNFEKKSPRGKGVPGGGGVSKFWPNDIEVGRKFRVKYIYRLNGGS